MKAKLSTLKQELSKDMKKQGHVSKKKPSNKKLSSDESLAETPKKGTYREPNSKKLSSETSLQKSHKLVHLKEFSEFSEFNESILTDVKNKVSDIFSGKRLPDDEKASDLMKKILMLDKNDIKGTENVFTTGYRFETNYYKTCFIFEIDGIQYKSQKNWSIGASSGRDKYSLFESDNELDASDKLKEKIFEKIKSMGIKINRIYEN